MNDELIKLIQNVANTRFYLLRSKFKKQVALSYVVCERSDDDKQVYLACFSDKADAEQWLEDRKRKFITEKYEYFTKVL